MKNKNAIFIVLSVFSMLILAQVLILSNTTQQAGASLHDAISGALILILIIAGAYGIKRLHDRGVSKW